MSGEDISAGNVRIQDPSRIVSRNLEAQRYEDESIHLRGDTYPQELILHVYSDAFRVDCCVVGQSGGAHAAPMM